MTDKPLTKQQESILAVKNLQAHLSKVFQHINNSDAVLLSAASELESIARQVGAIKIEVYTPTRTAVNLSDQLFGIANNLKGART